MFSVFLLFTQQLIFSIFFTSFNFEINYRGESYFSFWCTDIKKECCDVNDIWIPLICQKKSQFYGRTNCIPQEWIIFINDSVQKKIAFVEFKLFSQNGAKKRVADSLIHDHFVKWNLCLQQILIIPSTSIYKLI